MRGVFAKILEIMIDFGPPVSAADNLGGALNVVGMGISGVRILATPAPRTQKNWELKEAGLPGPSQDVH